MSKNQTNPQFKVRMPPELKEKLQASALKMNRTMNADLISRLSSTFGDEYEAPAKSILASGSQLDRFAEIALQAHSKHIHDLFGREMEPGDRDASIQMIAQSAYSCALAMLTAGILARRYMEEETKKARGGK